MKPTSKIKAKVVLTGREEFESAVRDVMHALHQVEHCLNRLNEVEITIKAEVVHASED